MVAEIRIVREEPEVQNTSSRSKKILRGIILQFNEIMYKNFLFYFFLHDRLLGPVGIDGGFLFLSSAFAR